MKLLTSVSLASLLLSGGIQTSCSKSSDSSSPAPTQEYEGDDDDDETDESTAEVNALSVAYPGSLALSMFPEGGSSLRLAEEDDAGTNVSYQAKVEEADKRMRGEGECFTLAQIQEKNAAASNITCYEFDSDMNPSEFSDRPGQSWGTLDGTDGNGQACMVTFAKDQVESVTQQVDRALAIVQGLLCVAKKDAEAKGEELADIVPDADAVELAEIINAGLPDNAPIEFSKADMSAVTNDDGSVTYITQVDVLKVDDDRTDSIILRHTPATDDVDENGILTFVREPTGVPQNNDPNQGHEKYSVMSIRYERSVDDDGEAHMVAELNQANIHQDYEPFNDEGLVNFEALPDAAQNDDVHAIKYVSFDVNPENGAGSLSYWMNPGGSKNESARGFLFNISADDDGLLSGCGISGSTQSISIRAVATDSSLTLAPVKYWHPRGNQNQSADKDDRYTANEGNYVTQQCFTQDATSGLYTIDTAKTTHDRGYDVIAGTATEVRPPERPPVPANLPPPPPVGAVDGE